MADKVYVLGAGASKDAGLPLIEDFKDEEFLEEKIDEEDNETYLKAKSFLDLLEENGLERDIEKALTNLVCSKFLKTHIRTQKTIENNNNDYPENHKENLEWLIAKCVSIKEGKIPSFYFDFFEKVGEENATIITFNYDIIPELCFEKLEIDYDLGFYGYDYEFKKRQNEDKNKPLILKLHGSIDWLYCEDCGINVYGEKDYYDKPQNRNLTLDFYEGEVECPQCKRKDNIKTVLIPPTMNKNIQQEFSGEKDIREIWLTASVEFKYADKVYFIGYSVREHDIFARNLFSISHLSAKSENIAKKKKYFVINPEDSEDEKNLKEDFEELLPGENKSKFIEKTFEKYIKSSNY